MSQNFICREDVLAILHTPEGVAFDDLRRAIEALPMFPAPNPGWEKNDRNVMGQTQDQFWKKVEDQYPPLLAGG